MAKEKKAKESRHIFKNLKSEFKKIIWLDRPTWFRQTLVVIVMAVFIALVIALLDIVINYGVDILISL